MIVSIQPSYLSGVIQAPTSKSSMQRACAAALLAKGISIIRNPGYSNDDMAALRVIEGLGAKVEKMEDGSLKISGNGVHPVGNAVNCGESGLGIRMFAPIIALSEKLISIDGEGSLLNRPMDFFDEVLPQLGVKVISNDGRLPLKVKGPLQPRTIEIDGSLSSQFLTGLLMAYAAAGANNVAIKVKNLKSKPYIDLTLQVMKHFGWEVENRNYKEFFFKGISANHNPDNYREQTTDYVVEGDWSGGAFLLVAGAIAGQVQLLGLQNTSTQADKMIVDALLDAGADVIVDNDKVWVKRNKLDAFEFDATDCPDLFPPLVALAAHCHGITRIRGLKRLKFKESDRGITLKEEFEKLSTQIDLKDDMMLVYGNGGVFVKNHTLNSHHDHRIAMACAVASLQADFPVFIRNPEAVKKSYPNFFSDLKKLSAHVEMMESGFSDAINDGEF